MFICVFESYGGGFEIMALPSIEWLQKRCRKETQFERFALL